MRQTNYKVTITEQDYNSTRYTAWVQATSKTQAVAMAAALAGQEKTRREFELMGRPDDLFPCGLRSPDVRLEVAAVDDYWEHRNQVVVA